MERQLEGNIHPDGFTLVEQIMVLLIIAVLSAIAVPALNRLLSRGQLQTAQMDFITAFQHARESAATTGKITLICPTADGRHCRADSRWEDGWLLAHDVDRDHQPDDDRVLYVGRGYGSKLRIRSNKSQLRFQPTGSAGGTNLTLLLCAPDRGSRALTVVVSNAGRIRGAQASKAQAAQCGDAN